MNEKRKHQRIKCSFRIHDKGIENSWVTEDISVGGCFLKAIERMPVGSKIDLVFELPGSTHYVEAVGEVKHMQESGMGVAFITMDNQERDEVENFVRDYH